MYLSALCKSRYRDYRNPINLWGVTKTQLRSNKTIILAMKLTAILLFTACLQVSANTYSQTITLRVENAPLDKVVKEIEKQSKFNFFYKEGLFQNATPVTISVSKSTVQQTLDALFSGQPFEYKIVQNTVFVKQKDVTNDHAQTQAVRIGNGVITGKVITKEGEPLVSANVMNKRSGKGTTTDTRGVFTLNDVNLDDILTISYIGYIKKMIKVSEFVALTLVMESAVNSLDKVQVQAYGTTTKRFATGNITTVTSEEIQQHPVMNVLQALQGKVPGLEIVQQNGFSSSPFKVEIRGRKYINSDLAPDPLIIVDNVPINVLNFQPSSSEGTHGFSQSEVPNPIGGQSPLFSIDPNEIESISVLKDADATAIYGSRGGSGVILITTKKGKPGATTFAASYSTGFQKNLRWYDLLNTQQYIKMRRESFENDNKSPTISNAPDLLAWDTTRYTDWQRYIYGGTGRVSNAEMNMSGGDRFTKYRMALGYDNRRNITTTSGGSDRISFSNSISHNTANNLIKIDFTGFYTFSKINTTELPTNAILLPPNAPSVFDSSNNLNFAGWGTANNFLVPFGGLLRSFANKTSFLNTRLSTSISPIKGFEIKVAVGYSLFDEDSKNVIPITSQNPQYTPTGSLTAGNTKGRTLIFEPQAQYKFARSIFNAEILVGATLQSTSQESSTISGSGYQDDNLLGSVANAPIKYGNDAFGEYKYAAIFSRLNFNFNNKYILNFTARRDGSSRFGSGKQYGNFGSIGGAWIISSEKWFRPLLKVISFAKLRGSYGTVGSDNINDYVYLTRWSGDRNVINPYSGIIAYSPIQHANPELQWQQTKKLEVGLNIGLFSDRLTLETDWYRDRISDQLLYTPLPVMTGFPNVAANLPAIVENSGLEFKLNYEIYESKTIRIAANFNIGVNKNKIFSFPAIENTTYANVYSVGRSLNSKYLVKLIGVDPTTGQYEFNDKNNDGTITSGINSKNPDAYFFTLDGKYFGGFGLDISIRQFSLSTFCTYANRPYVQRAIYNTTYIPGTFGYSNQSVRVLNRWVKQGDNAEFAKFTTTPKTTDRLLPVSDGIFSNGSFIRLQNVSLNYVISKGLIKKIKCQEANIFMKAENIALFTNYDGLDPMTPGLGSYPLPFTLTIGANLNF